MEKTEDLLKHKEKIYKKKLDKLYSHIILMLKTNVKYFKSEAFECNVNLYYKYLEKISHIDEILNKK